MSLINRIYQGDCLSILKQLGSESINCCITSPPYWALRDYGVAGQLGLETTFEEYINKLCNIFDEVKRVLKKDGTCWIVIGDTYFGGGGKGQEQSFTRDSNTGKEPNYTGKSKLRGQLGKSLVMIPFRFAIEMVNRGWILRNTIIWYKPNCMPASVKDRFTVDFEYVFFFVKNKKYWFEQQLEKSLSPIKEPKKIPYSQLIQSGGKETQKLGTGSIDGRNKRVVWQVTTKPFSEAHFATYPPDLIEPMIKAGCPEFVCNKCGKARKMIKEFNGEYEDCGWYPSITGKEIQKVSPTSTLLTCKKKVYNDKGYTDCNCNAGFEGGIVLDPFFGAGTTGLVAKKLNRNYIGIELNEEYIKIAQNRINNFTKQLTMAGVE